MKRVLAALFVTLVVLSGAAKCGEKVCTPGEVREDSYQSGRYWQCNEDGTKENPVQAPGERDDSIEALR